MFKILDKKQDTITIKMDMNTYEGLKEEIDEDISSYEFVFDTPVPASDLVK